MMRQAIYSRTHPSFIILSVAAFLTGCSPPTETPTTTTPTPVAGSTRILEVTPTPEPSEPKPTLTGERFTVGRFTLKSGDRIEQEYSMRMMIGGKLSGTDSSTRWIKGSLSGGATEEVSWETDILAVSEGEVTELRDRITRARRQSAYQGSTTYSKDVSESDAKRSPLEGKIIHHRKGIRTWQASIEGMPESEATGLEAKMSGSTVDPLMTGLFPQQPIPVGHIWTLTKEQNDSFGDTFPFDAEVNNFWETDNQATATFQKVTDYEGERCAVIQIRLSQQVKQVSQEFKGELSVQGTLYVSLDSGLILKQVFEGPVRLHGESDSPDLETKLTGKLKYERYMRKQTSRPTEMPSD